MPHANHDRRPAPAAPVAPVTPLAPVAVITGGGSGIGLACARQLAALGYRLNLVGRSLARLEAARRELPGADVLVTAADIADPAAAPAVVDATLRRFSRLDALVNNAGQAVLRPVHEFTDADVAEVFAVNALGPIALVIRALPGMLAAGSGVVVNVSSRASATPFAGLSVYGAAKAALNTLARGLATEYGPRGLRAYSVAPGAVETDMLRSLFTTEAVPADRCLTPDDVAAVIVACITGSTSAGNGDTIPVAAS